MTLPSLASSGGPPSRVISGQHTKASFLLLYQTVPNQKPKTNWSCLLPPERPMRTLTQYGRMAEKHWRQFRPRMVQELEAKGLLEQMLLEAEEKTEGMEARVSAIDRLVREGLLGASDQLAEVDDEVDGQLEALERELGR